MSKVTDAIGKYRKLEQQEFNLMDELISMRKKRIDSIDEFTMLNEQDRINVCNFLYWETDISVPSIGSILCVGTNRVGKTVGPYDSGFTCKICEKSLMWTSRLQRDSGYAFYLRLCDDCRRQKDEEQHKRWDYEAKQRKQEDAIYLHALKNMPYPTYLATDHWQEIRKAALKRALYRCQLCNSKGILDVHHRTYDRRGEENNSDVIVLCRDCHSKFHEKN